MQSELFLSGTTAPTIPPIPGATPSGVVPLWEHQQVALAAVRERHAAGITRQIVSIATGGGKTRAFIELIRQLLEVEAWDGAVIIVHRDELVDQTVQALHQHARGLTVGIVKAERNELGQQVTVASAQTLAHERRLAALTSSLHGRTLLIVDEAHHAVADTWQRAVERIDAALTVGFTATAYRADARALGALFEEIVYHLGMLPLIAEGKLANLLGLRIDTAESLDGVHTVAGEFKQGELSEAIDTPGRNQLVVDSWMQHAHAKGRQRTVAFCVDTTHARHVVERFRASGVPAELVLGETEPAERRRIYQAFREGTCPVLVNCMVLTEGWDEPRADCGLMLRPTKSLGLYVQMAGRLARWWPDKRDALIVDYVDASTRHKLISLPTLAANEAAGGDRGGAEERDAADRRADGEQLSLLDAAERIGQVRAHRAEAVDLFGNSPHIWHQAGGHWMTTDPLPWRRGEPRDPRARYLTLLPEEDGYVPVRVTLTPPSWGQAPAVERLWDSALDVQAAIAIAEARVPRSPLTDREATWRAREPSAAQLGVAKARGIPVPRDATSGEVSDLIDQDTFAKGIRRLGGRR